MQDPTGMHNLPHPHHLRLAQRLVRTRPDTSDLTLSPESGCLLPRTSSETVSASRALLLRRIAELRGRLGLVDQALRALERYQEIRALSRKS